MNADTIERIRARMNELGIEESTLIEKFVLGSGSGGQKINKTSSCVYLKDPVSGIETKCQASRSREENRWLARRHLCDRLDDIRLGRESERQQEFEKIRRQKRRRSRRQKAIMLADKRARSATKQNRGAVSPRADD